MSARDDRVDAVFSALSDPTRRALLGRLGTASGATATELTAHVPVSRQAIAKHLQALSEAGLVVSTRSGREVRYELTPAPLGDAVDWMMNVGAQWDRRLARLRSRFETRAR